MFIWVVLAGAPDGVLAPTLTEHMLTEHMLTINSKTNFFTVHLLPLAASRARGFQIALLDLGQFKLSTG